MKWKVHTNHRGRMSLAWAIKNRQTKPQQQRYFGRGFGEKKKGKSARLPRNTRANDRAIPLHSIRASRKSTRSDRRYTRDSLVEHVQTRRTPGKEKKKRKRNGTERNGLLKKRCICSKKGKWLAQVVAFPNLTVRISYIVKYRPRCNRW